MVYDSKIMSWKCFVQCIIPYTGHIIFSSSLPSCKVLLQIIRKKTTLLFDRTKVNKFMFYLVTEDDKEKKDEDNNSTHSTGFSPTMLHLASTIFGLMAAYVFFEKSIVYLICLAILSYR